MRVIRRNEIKEKTGYCYHWCVLLEKRGEFPKRISLGPRAVGWLESEIDAWLKKRVAERDRKARAERVAAGDARDEQRAA